MGKDAPDTLGVTDYSQLMNQQANLNRNAAEYQTGLNRPNVSNTFDSTQWRKDPTTGVTTQVNSIDPALEAAQRQQIATSHGASNLASGLINSAPTNVNMSGAPSIATGVNQYSTQDGPSVNMSAPNYGGLMAGPLASGGIQSQYNFSGSPTMPTYDQAARDKSEQAFYGRQTSLLQPGFTQQEDALRNRLSNQGLTQGSEAFDRELSNLRGQQNATLQNAAYGAVGAGADEAARQYGLGMQGRQQGVSEAINQGQFGNSAQQQQYGQNIGNAELYNNAATQDLNNQLGIQGAFNSAQQQNFGQGIGLNDQYFNQAMQNAGLQNSARGQFFNEAQTMADNPYRWLGGLMGGGQNSPTGNQSGIPGAGQYQNPVDLVGAANNAQNGALGAWSAQNAGNAQAASSIAAIIAAMYSSDETLKHDITEYPEIDVAKLTPVIWKWNSTGTIDSGIVAQEVQKIAPHLVVADQDGKLLVNYTGLFAALLKGYRQLIENGSIPCQQG